MTRPNNSVDGGGASSSVRSMKQEKLWRRVLDRRMDQLSLFSIEQLRGLSGFHDNTSTKKSLTKYIRERLESYFERSVNPNLEPTERSESLDKLKSFLAALDAQHAKAVVTTFGRRHRKADSVGAAAANSASSSISNSKNSNSQSKTSKKANSSAPISDTNTARQNGATTATATGTHDKRNKDTRSASSQKTPPAQSVPVSAPPRPSFTNTILSHSDKRTENCNVPATSMGSVLSNKSKEPHDKVPPSHSTDSKNQEEEEEEEEEPLPPKICVLGIVADIATPSYSSSQAPRSACRVAFDKNATILNSALKREFDSRLQRWDPFWTVINDLTIDNSSQIRIKGVRTTEIARLENMNYGEKPLSCLSQTFQLTPSMAREKGRDNQVIGWGCVKRNDTYRDGERCLLLRMLPIPTPEKSYKADTHLFPKGTFIQLNGKPISGIYQRKQQSHDHALWKGMCHALNLTSNVKYPCRINNLEMISMEKGNYGLQIAICEYNTPAKVMSDMMKIIETIPYKDSLDQAKKYVNCQTVVLDSDDEGMSNDVFTTFHLSCPISMKPMETPVRGRQCKHMQCFDLRNFLHSNSFPSGRRWRCLCCENFVSPFDLVICGLFQRMLEKHKEEASEGMGEVEFRGDGRWGIVKDKTKKRKAPSVNETSVPEVDVRVEGKRKPPPEVIFI